MVDKYIKSNICPLPWTSLEVGVNGGAAPCCLYKGNIPNVKVSDINHFSAIDVVKYKKLILTASSVKELEKRYS